MSSQLRSHRLVGDRLAVDQDALGEPLEVRAREQAGAQPVRPQQALDHATRRGLAVRAGDVDHRRRAMRVAEELDRTPRRLETRPRRALADPREQRFVDGVGRLAVARIEDLGVVVGHRSSNSMSRADASPTGFASAAAAVSADVATSNSTASVSPAMSSRWRRGRFGALGVERQREADAVADVEAGGLARLLHGAHDVAREALRLELGVVAVSRMTKPPSPRRPSALDPSPDPPASSTSSYSPGSRAMPPATTVSPSSGPVAGSGGLDGLLHGLAEAGSGGAGVHREALRDAEGFGARLVELDELDGLHVELVAQDASNGTSAGASVVTTVSRASGSRTRDRAACAGPVPPS